MESILTFGLGILTCVIIAGVVYGIYKIREVSEYNSDLINDLDDLQAKYNLLERDFENKIDVVSNKIIDVDTKLDTMYQQASDEIRERLEEIEDDLNKLQINE